MPSLLTPPFPTLIHSIPILQHAEEVEALPWRSKFIAAGQAALWTTIFAGLPSVRITRERLLTFVYATQEQKCAEILLWGYPSDKRGIASRLLLSIGLLPALAAAPAAWPAYFRACAGIHGLNISTISKLAYFYQRNFGGFDALILDQRVIDNTARWAEVAPLGLTYDNARHRYLRYLEVMYATAGALHCTADRLEFFLFALGDSF